MDFPQINPSRLLRYDSVVRLTQYVPTENGAMAEDAFVAGWREAFGASSTDGVVYRELCRQVPAWSERAKREIDTPIQAAFLEYLIVEAWVDLTRLPALPYSAEGAYRVLQDVHSVAFHFAKKGGEQRPGALMFNLFEIDGPAGMEQGFLMAWPPRGEFKIHEPATLSTVLHQRMLPEAGIKAFNRAEVTSAEEYAAGIDRFQQAFPRAERKAGAESAASGKSPIRSHLGLFEIVALAATAPASSRAAAKTMNAVIATEFGPPSVLRVERVPVPAPGPGQVRVRVKACSINPLDVKMRSGEVRHIYPAWFPEVYGYSVSGVVEALGAGATTRVVGEEVYGINNPILRHGYAESVCGPESNFYPKPAAMDFATAAAAPSVFATAFGALFLRFALRAGQSVLIHGGSGVIGSCAVQLAKQAGARVIATASTANVDRVRELGADVVVDYKTHRFEEFAMGVDLVVDTVGGETRERSWPLLRKGGAMASLLPPPPDAAMAERYGVQGFMVHGHPNIVEIMPEMTGRLERGELGFPEIAKCYPLAEAAAAHADFERSAPRGRLVLMI
jgi:NADPH:quinone reductase-like Zn-dependent oxidoreductase